MYVVGWKKFELLWDLVICMWCVMYLWLVFEYVLWGVFLSGDWIGYFVDVKMGV